LMAFFVSGPSTAFRNLKDDLQLRPWWGPFRNYGQLLRLNVRLASFVGHCDAIRRTAELRDRRRSSIGRWLIGIPSRTG
jgi:hypothetical protein